jgi:hypothetical protein
MAAAGGRSGRGCMRGGGGGGPRHCTHSSGSDPTRSGQWGKRSGVTLVGYVADNVRLGKEEEEALRLDGHENGDDGYRGGRGGGGGGKGGGDIEGEGGKKGKRLVERS